MISIIKDVRDYELKNELLSGALHTLDTIIEKGKLQELIYLLDELFQEPVDIITINDLLWFEEYFIYEQLGIELEEELTCSKSL